jgi:hypothetical protein
MPSDERDPPCCASCKFYRLMPEEELEDHAGEGLADEVGRCVRYPPVFFYHKLLNAEFPVVQAGAWCGEYDNDSDI